MKILYCFTCIGFVAGFAFAELEVEQADSLGKGLLGRYQLAEQQMNLLLGRLPVPADSEAHRLGNLNDDGSITVTTVILEGQKVLVAEDLSRGESNTASRSVWDCSSDIDPKTLKAMPTVGELKKAIGKSNPDKHLLSNWFCLYQYRAPDSVEWETVRCPMQSAGEQGFAKLFVRFKNIAGVIKSKRQQPMARPEQ